jgi:hypothetical protein
VPWLDTTEDGMASQESPGTYLHERIGEWSRKVAKTNNSAGYVAMWPEITKEVLAKFPNLSPAEKATLLGTIHDQIQLLAKRTGQDQHGFTSALDEVARILKR